MGLIESLRRQQEFVRAQQAEQRRAEEKAKADQTSSEHLGPMLKMVYSKEINEALLNYFNKLHLENPPIFKPMQGCGDEGQGKDQPRRLYASTHVYISDAKKASENNGSGLREYFGVTISCVKNQFSYCFFDGHNEHVFTSFEELLSGIANLN